MFAGGVAGGAALSWHTLLFSSTNVEATRREIAIRDLPPGFDGMRIVQLSDLHFSPLVSRAYLEKCIEMTNALQPDWIFLTGDYVSTGMSRDETIRGFVDPLAELLSNLRARDGVFAVMGNHDMTVQPVRVRQAITAAGISVLRNQSMELTVAGERLPLVGLADYATDYIDEARAFADIDPDAPALIMMHNPDYFARPMRHRNGLILAGHTHGGQIVLPIIGPAFALSIRGNRYLQGLFHKDRLAMLVNRGLGVVRLRMRLNCRPEISEIILRSAV